MWAISKNKIDKDSGAYILAMYVLTLLSLNFLIHKMDRRVSTHIVVVRIKYSTNIRDLYTQVLYLGNYDFFFFK